MRSSSVRFDPYQPNYRLAAKATILPSGVVVPITEGNVNYDAQSAIRGSGDFTVVDDGTLGLIPTDNTSVLSPYGNEIRVQRGIEYYDGEIELITIGVFRIERSTIASAPGELEVRVTAMDRAQEISDAKFEEPYSIPNGTNIIDALETLLSIINPGVVTDFPVVDIDLPKVIAAEGDDPWDFMQKIAKAFGAELFFDYEGILVLRPIPAAGGIAVGGLHEQNNLLSIEVDWDREPAYNRVIATGQNATGGTTNGPGNNSAVPRGIATDDDPASPTRYDGVGPNAFGKKPLFYESEFITTDDQADTAAAGELERNKGIAQHIHAETIVDPRFEPGDVVEVTREIIGIVQETHIIDVIRIPLSASEGMNISTRLSRVLGS